MHAEPDEEIVEVDPSETAQEQLVIMVVHRITDPQQAELLCGQSELLFDGFDQFGAEYEHAYALGNAPVNGILLALVENLEPLPFALDF